MKKKIILLSLLISMCYVVMAQDKFETTISADMVSQYIWRGQECGSVSLQPTLDVSYKGLSFRHGEVSDWLISSTPKS